MLRKTIFEQVRGLSRALLPANIRRTVGMDLLGSFYRNNYYNMFHPVTGRLKSTRYKSRYAKNFVDSHFQHREKAEVALAAATSWYGGDYMVPRHAERLRYRAPRREVSRHAILRLRRLRQADIAERRRRERDG